MIVLLTGTCYVVCGSVGLFPGFDNVVVAYVVVVKL